MLMRLTLTLSQQLDGSMLSIRPWSLWKRASLKLDGVDPVVAGRIKKKGPGKDLPSRYYCRQYVAVASTLPPRCPVSLPLTNYPVTPQGAVPHMCCTRPRDKASYSVQPISSILSRGEPPMHSVGNDSATILRARSQRYRPQDETVAYTYPRLGTTPTTR